MSAVLVVSKPVAPPWNDGSKNLVRELALGLSRYTPHLMGSRTALDAVPRARIDPVYQRSDGFSGSLRQQGEALRRLALGARLDCWHFFFAPTMQSAMAGALVSRLRRRVPTVQTVASVPSNGLSRRALFADRIVVLSQRTLEQVTDLGFSPSRRLRRIAPGITPLEVPTSAHQRSAREQLGLPLEAPLVVFAGDLSAGGGASELVEALRGLPEDVLLALACRMKTPHDESLRGALLTQAQRWGVASRVHWLGEVNRIHDLLGTADVVALPARSLVAKVDYPLVLLEAMSLERAVLVGLGTPAAELAEQGGACAVETSTDAVMHGLRDLLEDADKRHALGRSARRLVQTIYHRDVMASHYERLYDELV